MTAAFVLAAARFHLARARFWAWHWLATRTRRHHGAHRMCVAVKDMHFALLELL